MLEIEEGLKKRAKGTICFLTMSIGISHISRFSWATCSKPAPEVGRNHGTGNAWKGDAPGCMLAEMRAPCFSASATKWSSFGVTHNWHIYRTSKSEIQGVVWATKHQEDEEIIKYPHFDVVGKIYWGHEQTIQEVRSLPGVGLYLTEASGLKNCRKMHLRDFHLGPYDMTPVLKVVHPILSGDRS